VHCGTAIDAEREESGSERDERQEPVTTSLSDFRAARELSTAMDTTRRLAQLAADATDAPTPRAALRQLGDLRRELDAFERRQVQRALAEGASFAAIARDLGISRQAVHRRFRGLAPKDLVLATAPEVRLILQTAREEAVSMGADDLGSEHLLLAVLRSPDLPAARLLSAGGVSLDRARIHVDGATTRGRLFRREAAIGDLRVLLEAPARAARARDSRRIEVDDLLLGALEDPDGGACRTLRALGVQPEAVREALTAGLSPAAGG
jgi:transposase-like protein